MGRPLVPLPQRAASQAKTLQRQVQVLQARLDAYLPAVPGGTADVTFSATAPALPRTGDLWYNTANGMQVSQWNGTAWVPYQYGTQALASGSVQAGNIAANAVGNPQLATNAVGTPNIQSNAVGTAQIATGAVTGTQLASSVTARSLGGITTTISATAPSSPNTGDIWINTANGYQISQYSGSAWTAVTWTASDVIAAGSVTAAQIAANTITVSQLAAGIVYAGIINGTTVNAATFTGSVFQGTDFVINSSGAFFYRSTPAAGNLALSIAQFAGTDAFSNGYPAGVASYAPSGTSQIDEGTAILTDSYGNSWAIVPVPQLSSSDPLYLEVFTPAGNSITISNMMPGALAVSQTDVNTHSNTTTTPTAITKSWSIPANDAQAGTVYRLKAYGNGGIGGTNTLVGIYEIVGGSDVISTGWNSGAIATSTTFELYIEATIAVKSAGSSGVVEYHIRGEAVPHGRVGTSPVVFVDTATTQALNTTVANTFAVGAAIGTPASGTTIGTFTSTLERLGP